MSVAQNRARHLAQRAAAVIGVLAGATNGVVRALQAAEVLSAGVRFGVAAGIRVAGGPVAGTVGSALAAALLEGAAGCALRVRFGEAIDRFILPNHRCLSCGQLHALFGLANLVIAERSLLALHARGAS